MNFNIYLAISAEIIKMSVLPQASLFLGLIPALALLFISIKGYDDFYKDKYLFLSIVIGVIIGFIAAFVQSFTLVLSIIYIVLLAFFDQLIKTIILNIGRLQKNKETPIYGLALGLGFGSSFTPLWIIAVSTYISTEIIIVSIVTVGSIGVILFHGATGAFIGYGVYKNKLFKSLFISIILQLPFNLLIGLMFIYSNINNYSMNTLIGIVIALLIYAGFIYYHVTMKILPNLKEIEKDKKRS